MITKIVATVLLERPARKYDYAGWAQQLTDSGQAIAANLNNSAETDKNRQLLRHIIGIEIWAQHRLRVALGEPFKQEEYTAYAPDQSASWDDLRAQFVAVRADSVALAEELAEQNVPLTTTVMHNQMGNLTVRGWLRYIYFHASFELRRIK